MALLVRNEDGTYGSECPLCDKVLVKPIFATSHFIADQSDRLYPYSDAAMHWSCYANWKYQKRFANQYFEAVANSKYKNPYWPTVLSLQNVIVRANCDLNPPVAEIDLRFIGPGMRVSLQEWEDWLNGGYREHCSHPLELAAYDAVLDDLRLHLPTFESFRVAAHAAKNAIEQSGEREPPIKPDMKS